MTEVLFVHGALVRDGGWWWEPVARLLRAEAGVESRAVALPSCGEGGVAAGAAGLAEDAAALRAALDDSDDAIVVAHSYGGTVVAEGADHPAARHLVYISSYLPEAGTAQAAIMAGEPDPAAIVPGADGTLVLDSDAVAFAARFLHDVEDERVRAEAWARVTAQSASAFVTPTTTAAWRGRPSTYLVCTRDRSTSVALQRQHAARATAVVDLEAGHHPFLSTPQAVAAPLLALLRA